MDGIIIINKPQNCTSHDVVYKVKKIFNQKVGHTGTLDPMATGVLPLLVGKGTLCSKYLINHDKTYEVELELGKKTDTGDIEGNIVEEKEIDINILNSENVEETLKTFLGKQEQMPPMYSAIKVKGKKLYEYARKGQKVEVEPRKIEIFEIELLNIDKISKIVQFKVHCSKGTYIRSLCEDIAERLGTIRFYEKFK
jgi:tRNA pseudouridine55 synthase